MKFIFFIFFILNLLTSCYRSSSSSPKSSFVDPTSPSSPSHQQVSPNPDSGGGSPFVADYIYKLIFSSNTGVANLDYDPATGLINPPGQDYSYIYASPTDFFVTSDSSFLYLLTNNQDIVTQYSLNALGDMTPLSPSTGGTSSSPIKVMARPDNQFAYVLSYNISNSIDIYSINPATGQLTSIGGMLVASPSAGGIVSTKSMAISSNSQYLYVGAYDGTNVINFIAPFAIDAAGGGLTPLGYNDGDPTQTAISVGSNPNNDIANIILLTTPNNQKFLYAVENGIENIGIFSVSSGGPLSFVSNFTPTYRIDEIVASPDGKYLYGYGSGGGNDRIFTFTVDANTGALTETSFVDPANAIRSLAISPDGLFLYATNDQQTILIYSIDVSDGSLTANAANNFSVGQDARQLRMNNLGTVLFVSTNDNNDSVILKLSRNSTTGKLTNIYLVNLYNINGFNVDLKIPSDRRFLYLCNAQGGNVYQFSLDQSTGAITPLSTVSVSAGGFSYEFALFNDQFLYVTNYVSHNIDQYTIDQNSGLLGSLSSYNPSGTATLAGSALVSLSSGTYFYVSDVGNNVFYQYAVEPTTGALTDLSPFSVSLGGNQAADIVVVPGTNYAYAPNRGQDDILQLVFDQTTGQVATNGGTEVLPGGDVPQFLSVTPDAKYAYVYGQTTGNVYQYAIGANGLLSALTPSFVYTGFTFASPPTFSMTITITHDSKYLYVCTPNGLIFQYAIGANGQLTPLNPNYVQTVKGIYKIYEI
ncbi:MAG: beta-propeller fold lactonase family protein [Silvanigrellaceae bacterium]|nr:beta-propeller fold lactonase family protein [Silvanigrellaceae bacterium]